MRKSLEVISLVVFGYMVWITYSALSGPNHLPDRIPTHFDAAGNVNGWGSPSMLLLLPIVAIALYSGITVVSRFPAAFNYPVRVQPAMRAQVESITLDMIAWIKAELLLMFASLQSTMIRGAEGGSPQLNPILVPVFIAVIFATIGWHMFSVIRVARQQFQRKSEEN